MDSLITFLGVFFVLLALGLPIGISLGTTMVVLVVFKSSLPLLIVSQQIIIGADNFTLEVTAQSAAGKITLDGGLLGRDVRPKH